MGCISAYGLGSLHVLEGTMNAKRYIKVLEQHTHRLEGRIFQQDNAKLHTAAITTKWLRSRRVRVLNWPACSPDLSPIETIWHIIKHKICQRWPWTLQQLENYIKQEWNQIPTPNLQKLRKTNKNFFLVNCWPSGKYVNLLYMYSILGRGSFCFNYCLNSAWHGSDQFVALLRWYGSPAFFDSGLQVICIVGSGVSHLPLDNTP